MFHVKHIIPVLPGKRGERIITMKKLVRVEGRSGRLYKMYLHKQPNNERGWYITEDQYNKMLDREPFGWTFDREGLEKIGCKWVNLVYRNWGITDVIIWEER